MLKDLKEYFELLFNYMRGSYLSISSAILLGIVAHVSALVIPFITRFLIDVVIGQRYYEYFKYILLISLVLLLVLLLTSLSSNYLFFKFFGRAAINLKMDIFKNLQFAPLEFYGKTPSGGISYRLLSDAQLIANSWMDCSATIPLHSIFFIAVIFMFRWHKELALFVSIILILQIIIIAKFRKPLLLYSYRVKEKNQEVLGYTVEHFSKIQLVRSLNTERKEQDKFLGKLSELLRTSLRAFMINRFSSTISLVVNNLWALGILWYGGMQVVNGGITLGTLIAFLIFANILYQPISVLATFVLSFQDIRASLRRALEYKEIKPKIVELKDAIEFTPSNGKILIKDCSFGYYEDMIIKGINLEIPPQSIFALVGQSGAGKTTLCRLLVRFYDPQKGQILLDGKDIRKISLSSLRKSVLLTLQNEYVFSGTVIENVTYGSEGMDKKRVLIALKRAAIDFIDKLPCGVYTKIGPDGMNVSAGEAQRIALARAFLLSPKVFILDEPTSFIDCETENKIKLSLQELRKQSTIILIAHRLSTVMIADNVAVMHNGEIKEVGKPFELLGDEGSIFRKIHTLFLTG